MILARITLSLIYIAMCCAVWLGARKLATNRSGQSAPALENVVGSRHDRAMVERSLVPEAVLDLRGGRDLDATLADLKASLTVSDTASAALLVDQLDRHEVVSALQGIDTITDPGTHNLCLHLLLTRWAALDGQAAIAYMGKNFPVDKLRQRLPGLVEAWAKNHPEEAFDWALQQLEILQGTAQHDSRPNLNLAELVGMRERPPDFERMFGSIIRTWGIEDLDTAIEHALELPEREQRQSLNALAALFGVFDTHREELLKRAHDLPRTDEVLQYAAMSWSDSDLTAFAHWLDTAELSEHERAIFENELISRHQWSHPDFIADWLVQNRSGEDLESRLAKLIASWGSGDRQSADRWIGVNIREPDLRARLEAKLDRFSDR